MRLPPTPRPPRLSRSGLILALYSSLTLAAIAWGALRGRADIYRLSDRTTPSRMLVNLSVGLLLGVGAALVYRATARRVGWVRVLHQEFRHLLGPLSGDEILLLAAASAIGEECFFRGVLLPWLGVWLSSAVFALFHIGPGARFLPWTATSLLFGLAMGGLMLGFGDLGGPIAAHFAINFLNLHYIARHDLADA